MNNNFTIYSKPGCPYCTKIKNLFEQKKFKYVEYMLDLDFTKDQFKSQFGESTFPRVVMDDKLLGGASETVQYLQGKGLL